MNKRYVSFFKSDDLTATLFIKAKRRSAAIIEFQTAFWSMQLMLRTATHGEVKHELRAWLKEDFGGSDIITINNRVNSPYESREEVIHDE